MGKRFPRVILACVMLCGILLVTQFANALAGIDDVFVPTADTTGVASAGSDPAAPMHDPGGPHGTQPDEGALPDGHGKAPIVSPQAMIQLAPVIMAQTAGWPRTTAETTLAIAVTNPPVPNKWIDVNLSRQIVTAYYGSTPIKSVLASTGTSIHPTIIGTFHVWAKVLSQTMEGGSHMLGDYYKLPHVTDIMYFYEGYALHGAYWHRNFGQPMSHGCVNLTLDDAAWLYDWSPPGITVRTHL